MRGRVDARRASARRAGGSGPAGEAIEEELRRLGSSSPTPVVISGPVGVGKSEFALRYAHDLAPDGITVNCVVPGLIDTKRGGSSGAKTAHLHETIIGRHGTPEEVASAVRFLAGPRARYVTGQDWHEEG